MSVNVFLRTLGTLIIYRTTSNSSPFTERTFESTNYVPKNSIIEEANRLLESYDITFLLKAEKKERVKSSLQKLERTT